MESIKKKILILGSTGMLGHVLFDHLKSYDIYEVYDVVYRTKLNPNSIICDVTHKEKLKTIIEDIRPNVVVNCIGVLIKGANTNPSNAIYINAFLPHFISKICHDIGAKMIHISTDCVFSGNKGGYLETDFKDADDIYGRSKALGELNNDKDLTIRTSIIGPELKHNGEGLLHWFLNQSGQINGFTSAFWSGVTTLECSKAIANAIELDTKGLVHLTNEIPIAKYELLKLFKSTFNKNNVEIIPFEGKQVNKSLKRSRVDFDYKVPDYNQMIVDMKEYMNKNKERYSVIYSCL